MIQVKRMGKATSNIAFKKGITVGEAITASGEKIEKENIKLDGEVANLTDKVKNSSKITILPKVKGA